MMDFLFSKWGMALMAVLLVGGLFGAFYMDRQAYVATGFVVEREFVPAHVTTTYHYNATTKMNQRQTIHHPDAWYVTVKGMQRRGEIGQYTHRVDETTYHAHKVGDTYNDEG